MSVEEIAIKGKVVTWAGKLKGYARKDSLPERISELGGTPAKSANAKVDIMLQGGRAADRLVQAARAFGCVILDAEQSLEVLEEGVVARDTTARGATLDELIGELRGLLAQPASNQTWDAILGVVESCHRDQEQALVDFLEPQLARWHDHHVSQSADGEDHVSGQLFYHMEDVEYGDLRHMPMRWYAEMLGGATSPKYSLPRVIHPGTSCLKSTANTRLFDLKDTRHITALDTDYFETDLFLKPAYYKALIKSKFAGKVESLRLYDCDASVIELLAGARTFTHLTRLEMECEQLECEDYLALLSSPLAGGLTWLGVQAEEVVEAIGQLDEDALPALQTICWRTPIYSHHPDAVALVTGLVELIARRGVHTLYMNEYRPHYTTPKGRLRYEPLFELLTQLGGLEACPVRTLDLSACETNVFDASFADCLSSALNAGLGPHLERCVVPSHVSDEALAVLRAGCAVVARA